MTLTVSIIILAAIMLPVLLYFETTENRKGLIPTKTSISLLFIVTAVCQPRPDPAYTHMLLTGLIFCLGGTSFLPCRSERCSSRD
ncbi:MAG: hypothetical protein U5R49_19250 [Deltaproteobacteria bacterium]|nr:hypothetical protein [Deltaproteobacteria bacterium]